MGSFTSAEKGGALGQKSMVDFSNHQIVMLNRKLRIASNFWTRKIVKIRDSSRPSRFERWAEQHMYWQVTLSVDHVQALTHTHVKHVVAQLIWYLQEVSRSKVSSPSSSTPRYLQCFFHLPRHLTISLLNVDLGSGLEAVGSAVVVVSIVGHTVGAKSDAGFDC